MLLCMITNFKKSQLILKPPGIKRSIKVGGTRGKDLTSQAVHGPHTSSWLCLAVAAAVNRQVTLSRSYAAFKSQLNKLQIQKIHHENHDT